MTIGSFRPRRRYLVFKILSPESADPNAFWDQLLESIRSLYGDQGLALIDPKLIQFQDNQGILRCSHLGVEMLKASICCITQLAREPCLIKLRGVTGSIKSARRKFGIVELRRGATATDSLT